MKKILALTLCTIMLLVMAIPVAAETNMTAPKATITLDGVRDDAYGDGYDIKSMQDNAVGATAKVWIAWDDDYLYYYFEVADTTPNHEAENDYGRDCIEMFFDWYNQKQEDTTDATKPYWQYRVASAPDASGQQFTNGINQAAGTDGTGWSLQEHVDSQSANSVVKLNDSGYIVEIRIEYKKFGIDVKEGSVIGIDFMIGDNQENAGRTSCAWLDPDSTSNNQWQYPNSVGGLLTLGAAAPVELVYEAAAEAGDTPAAVAETAPVTTSVAPQTGDMTVIFCVMALIGACIVSINISKRKA